MTDAKIENSIRVKEFKENQDEWCSPGRHREEHSRRRSLKEDTWERMSNQVSVARVMSLEARIVMDLRNAQEAGGVWF